MRLGEPCPAPQDPAAPRPPRGVSAPLAGPRPPAPHRPRPGAATLRHTQAGVTASGCDADDPGRGGGQWPPCSAGTAAHPAWQHSQTHAVEAHRLPLQAAPSNLAAPGPPSPAEDQTVWKVNSRLVLRVLRL